VGNVGDNSVSSYRVHVAETHVELLGNSRQTMTGRLATHTSNTLLATVISLLSAL